MNNSQSRENPMTQNAPAVPLGRFESLKGFYNKNVFKIFRKEALSACSPRGSSASTTTTPFHSK